MSQPTNTSTALDTAKRTATVSRQTKECETKITCTIVLDGSGVSDIHTGIGFLDHMFDQLAKHGRMDITLRCDGDLHVDDHHTAEDCACILGQAFTEALAQRSDRIRCSGHACIALDDCLTRVVVELSGRPYAVINCQFTREMIGGVSCEMLQHVFESFAMMARLTLHVHNLHGHNNHHKAESAFKALGIALRQAVAFDI